MNLVRVWPHTHARIDQALVDDLGADALVIVVRMPGDVGRPVGGRPRRLEAATDGFRNHVWAAREPSVFGDRLDDLLLVRGLLETIPPSAARLIGAIGVH